MFPTLLKTRNELHEAVEKDEVDVFMFTSWCNFPVYKIYFGWKKHDWVSRIHSGYEAATFLDREGGDGIEVYTPEIRQTRHLLIPARYEHFSLHFSRNSLSLLTFYRIFFLMCVKSMIFILNLNRTSLNF